MEMFFMEQTIVKSHFMQLNYCDSIKRKAFFFL